jgi:ribosome biogenesis GTPase / thiamine phosphate phosphatase
LIDTSDGAHDPAETQPTGMSPATEERSVDASAPIEGVVVAIAHGYSEVYAAGQTYLCVLRGRLLKRRPAPLPRRQPVSAYVRGARAIPQERPRAQPDTSERQAQQLFTVAPGDHVRFRPLPGGQGVIEEILPRRTVLSRARSEAVTEHVMLANLDHAVLVFAVREPEPHFGMLDRYLALCEHAGVDITVCLNKIDLAMPPAVADADALYARLGYTVLHTSAATGAGIESLRTRLAARISLLTGPSGVGKSSLMNMLLPDADLRVGAVSAATGKGRHTTTGVRLLPLGDGGWLADSAGIRELALWNVPADDLPRAFVELRPYLEQCAYDDCAHGAGEVGCALRAALADGAITPERFASFERLLQEARDAEVPAW